METKEEETVRIGVIMKNVASSSEKSQNLLTQFVVMIKSLLRNKSQRRKLGFVILTDPDSSHCLSAILKKNSIYHNITKTLVIRINKI